MIARSLLTAAALACLCLAAAPSVRAATGSDFALGTNAENQACKTVARFDAPRGAQSADIYCGKWDDPSGRITVYATRPDADAALASLCKGETTALKSS